MSQPHSFIPRANGFATFLAALIAWSVLVPSLAQGQDLQPVLREQIRVYSDLVTLGDIFDNAGPAASAPVFRSPDLGTQGVVAARRIATAARRHGLTWRNPGSIEQVTVERPGRRVTIDEIKMAVARSAARELGITEPKNLRVILQRRARAYYVHPHVRGTLTVRRIHLRDQGGIFEATIGFDENGISTRDRVYQGRLEETMEVPVLARAIARGETITREDVKMTRMPTSRMRGGIVMEETAIANMAARRALRADQPVVQSDIERPKLVRQGTLVTIVYEIPGLKLKSQGRAQADAAHGATVPVMNTRSNRMVQTVVRGPGLVAVVPAGRNIQAQRAPQPQRTANAGPTTVR